jgi:hypothetical protein
MSFAMIVYLIGMLKPLSTLVEALASFAWIAVLISSVLMIPATIEEIEHWLQKLPKMIKTSLIAAISLSVLMVLIPSKDTAYVMVAAYGIEGIVTDDRVQQIGGKSLDVIEQWLDELAPAQEHPQ